MSERGSLSVLLAPLLFGCFWLSACASSGPQAQVTRWDGTPRRPKPASAPIEVIDREDISRPFKSVAMIQISTQRVHDEAAEAKVREILKQKARELGGDALTDFARSNSGGQQRPVPYADGPSIFQDTWSAVVIVWSDDDEKSTGTGSAGG